MERAMFPLLGPLIAGGASLLGGIFSSNTSAQNTNAQIQGQEAMQQQSEQFNAQQADVNRQFQASQIAGQQEFENQMSSSAYQRASSDMRKAGLNPMMMFGSGGPSSTPSVGAASGSTASIGTPSVPMPQNTSPLGRIGDAVNAGLTQMINAKTIDKMTEEVAALKATEGRTEAETRTEGERKRLVGTEADIAGYRSTSAQAQAERDKIWLGIPSSIKYPVEYGKYIGGGVSSVGNAISSLVPTAQAVRRFLPESVTREGGRQYDPSGSGDYNEFWHTRTGF